MKINEKLRTLRIAKGLSQYNIAHELGIDTANYGRIERGEARLTIDRLEQILKILDTNMEQFFCDEGGSGVCSETLKQHIQTLINEIIELKVLLTNHKNQ